jgi:hypothetical protein
MGPESEDESELGFENNTSTGINEEVETRADETDIPTAPKQPSTQHDTQVVETVNSVPNSQHADGSGHDDGDIYSSEQDIPVEANPLVIEESDPLTGKQCVEGIGHDDVNDTSLGRNISQPVKKKKVAKKKGGDSTGKGQDSCQELCQDNNIVRNLQFSLI